MSEKPGSSFIGSSGGKGSARGSDEIRLLDYWRILVQRRAVFLSCLGLTVLVVMLFTFLKVPSYRASATIEISRKTPEVVEFTEVVGVDPGAYLDFYQTQYKILQSRTVIRRAVDQLDLVNRPEYVNRKGSPLGRLARWGKAKLFGEPDEAEVVVDPRDAAISFVQAGLSVSPVRSSQLTLVSFTDHDPVLATDVANAVASAYQQFQMDSRYDTTGQAKTFLAKDVARVRAEITELQQQLEQYGAEKEIFALGDGTKNITEQALADVSTEYVEAKNTLARAEARHHALRNASPEALQEVLHSPRIIQLRQKHDELERQYKQMSERFSSDWPALREVEEELETARAQLRRESETIAAQVRAVAEADYDQAQAAVESLEREREAQKREVRKVNLAEIQYRSLKAEIDTKRKVLSDLVERQSETETSYRLRETSTSNIRVIDHAEIPKWPVSPRKKLNLFVALVLGSLFGAGMAFLIDYLDNTVKSEQDIQQATSLAVLGHVPLANALRLVKKGSADSVKEATRLLDHSCHSDPKSTFSEAFRSLRTSLLLSAPDQPPRNIAITSCQPGDGKSTIAINLSLVLTQLGRRVLLIDADLRRPRLHKALDLANDVGLSNYLSGNAGAGELLQETELPNLQVITSGPVPPNPSELLGSPGLQALITKLHDENRFDHVIFDSPPVLTVTDAIILASRVDSTILVARSRVTSKEALMDSASRLAQSHAYVIGAVLNAVSEEGGYYYGGYRRYAYRYRYADQDEAEAAGAAGRRKGWRRRAS